MLNVGVVIDGFRKPLDEGLSLAAEFGCDGFQVYITRGEMLASNMSKAARSDFVRRYRDSGLALSATCGDFGMNFGDAAAMVSKEPLLKDAILQTVDMGADIMTTHIGALGDDKDGSRREIMVKNLKRLGDIAADNGVVLATETGLESGPVLRDLLAEADTRGIGVNFDPANLVMRGFDHFEALKVLAPYIVHTHAKDGIYADGRGSEVPVGQGQVNFPAYVAMLREQGFNGAYAIEREKGDDPVADIREAVRYLKSL